MKITATLITYNEESNIAAALETLAWADEIIVVDSESADRTAEIASRYAQKVIVNKWPGYAAQKNFAGDQASHDWVFSLDADERVSEELAAEIKRLKETGAPNIAAFEMPRRAFYLGRWIRHSGWYPDFKVRLYDRRRCRWQGEFVHESVIPDGEVGRLRGDLLHFTVRSVSEHHQRIDRYTTLAAQQAFAQRKRASLLSLVISPPLTFLRSYLLKLGFLDGVQGLAIAFFAAYYVFLKNLKLWEMGSTQKSKP
jgi:glycosyltransferase involved in cell wall biosynthesis